MTEFWKSNANYWCDICKVWMTDNVSTRATHEKGIKHKENVAKSTQLTAGCDIKLGCVSAVSLVLIKRQQRT
jgi:U1 zinc finger